MKTLQCRVCGAIFASQDDIEEDVHGTGFWCPECESFTPYAGITRIIDLSVCLETKAGDCRERQMDEQVKSDLQGRLSPLRYPVGKGKMLKQLEPHFPEHIGTMVEPFAAVPPHPWLCYLQDAPIGSFKRSGSGVYAFGYLFWNIQKNS